MLLQILESFLPKSINHSDYVNSTIAKFNRRSIITIDLPKFLGAEC